MAQIVLRALLITAVAGLFACSNPVDTDDRASGALDSAEAWLALVDQGKYSDSWETAASYFKTAVTEAQWEQAVTRARKPLGAVLSRTLKTKKYSTSLPGAPDGEYVVIQYETAFENKKSATETITPMMDEDGKWRVSGYYIK